MASPCISASLHSQRAAPWLLHIAQLVGLPPGARRRELWAANKTMHLPPGTLSCSLAASLKNLGLVSCKSITASCSATLARAAVDGKLEWQEWVSRLQRSAEAEQTMARRCSGLWWGPHWLSQPFAAILMKAVGGDVGLVGPLAGSASAAGLRAAGAAVAAQQLGLTAGVQKEAQAAIEQVTFVANWAEAAAARWSRIVGMPGFFDDEFFAAALLGLEKVPSSVAACAMKTWLAAWTTLRRMHCVFGGGPCGDGSLQHYSKC
jgi:hypothetical protein